MNLNELETTARGLWKSTGGPWGSFEDFAAQCVGFAANLRHANVPREPYSVEFNYHHHPATAFMVWALISHKLVEEARERWGGEEPNLWDSELEELEWQIDAIRSWQWFDDGLSPEQVREFLVLAAAGEVDYEEFNLAWEFHAWLFFGTEATLADEARERWGSPTAA